jgi:hypothetical protein
MIARPGVQSSNSGFGRACRPDSRACWSLCSAMRESATRRLAFGPYFSCEPNGIEQGRGAGIGGHVQKNL